MFKEVETMMKRQTRDQASKLSQQIAEMERLLADMKESVDALSEYGPCAVRGVAQRGTPAHMARVAAQIAASTQTLALLADLVDAANVGTGEEVGA